MARHSQLTESQGIHIAVRGTFANATARLAYVPVAADVGGIYVDNDTRNHYILASIGPAVWKSIDSGGGGGGDVVGPASATDDALARFDGATGKLIQNSGVTLSDSGSVVIPANQTISRSGGVGLPIVLPSQANGDIVYFNGTNWIRLAAGSSTQVLTITGGIPTWTTPASGGDVVGPASATDEAVARYDTTTGKLLQNSGAILSDAGSIVLPASQTITRSGGVGLPLVLPSQANGDTLYFNGTNWVRLPVGSASQVLTVAGGTPVWATPAVSTGTVLIRDRFITGQVTTGQLGEMGFKTSVTGTGAQIVIKAGEVGHEGIISMEAGTAATGRSAYMLGDSASAGHFLLNAVQSPLYGFTRIRMLGSLTAVNLEIVQFGWGLEWTATGELLNGVLARFLPGTDTFWTLVCANAGARTIAAGTTAPALGTWVDPGIRITYPGGVPTAQLMINGVAEGAPVTTNFPTTAQGWGGKIDAGSSVATESIVDVDYTEVIRD